MQMLGRSILALALGWLLIPGEPAQAQLPLEIEAYSGHPFGVAQVTLRLPPEVRLATADLDRLELAERSGRQLYPAVDHRPVRAILSDLVAAPQQVTAYFLFQGDGPLEVTLDGPVQARGAAVPNDHPRRFGRMLNDWWDAYRESAERRAEQDAYPVLADQYLTSMLAVRLGLRPPEPPGGLLSPDGGQVGSVLGLLSGSEAARSTVLRDTILRGIDPAEAALPLPPALPQPAVILPEFPADTAVEPIALHVPVECFYVRFGSFSNYSWFRSHLDRWGSDLRNLTSARGLDYGLNKRIEDQIVLHEGKLSGLLGPQVVKDVALIGLDPFFREGASFGILFEAYNSAALSADIRSKRAEALRADPQITERTVKIGDREVSFLSTPDNAVRSFYVVDGNYHLVTTSHRLAERFLEVREGAGSLGQSPEFRYARSLLPVEQQQAVFAYLSDVFLAHLVSPEYRIEMMRRMQAATDLELIELAKWAARAEGLPAESLEQLVEAGFLPPGFGGRPGGSGPVFENGRWIDSLRGAPGTFTPVPDVAFDRVTPREAQDYADFSRQFQATWQQMDPVMAAITRTNTNIENVERVDIQVYAAPLAPQHNSLVMRVLGPPSARQVVPLPEDIVHGEVVLQPKLLLRDLGVHHLFFGLRESPLPLPEGPVSVRDPRQWLNGYLGAWPDLGILRFLTGGAADFGPQGYALVARRLWQRQIGPFSVVSFHRPILDEVGPQLQMIEAERPAQVRLQVGDIAHSQLAPVAERLLFERAEEIAYGNLLLLHTLTSQLKVPQPEALAVAEDLLDAQLIDPLGGKYVLVEEPKGTDPRWVSSTWLQTEQTERGLPSDFRAAPLDWLRGLDLEAALIDNTLSAQITLLAEHEPEATFSFPSLPSLPSLPGFGSKPKPEPTDQPEELPPPKPATKPKAAPEE